MLKGLHVSEIRDKLGNGFKQLVNSNLDLFFVVGLAVAIECGLDFGWWWGAQSWNCHCFDESFMDLQIKSNERT